MRNFTLLLLVLCMSTIPQFLQAQEYEVLSSLVNANLSTSRNSRRYCKGISLIPQKSSVVYGSAQNVAFNEGINVEEEGNDQDGYTVTADNGPDYKVYNDLTNEASKGFNLRTGQTVNATFDTYNQHGYWDGAWMGSYIYVDANQNKIFKDVSSELVRSSGTSYSSSNHVNSVREFRLPTSAGQYRMRFIIAWQSEDPKGTSGIIGDGGSITDILLNLVDPVVSVSNNDAKGTVTLPGSAICGEDYSFTVEAKSGYSVASVVARCGENLDDAASENSTWKAITPTNSGTTYTVSGANFQGDMKIIVTYSLDTNMDLIKQGKQVFRLKNRSTSTYPYLMADHVDATTSTDRVVIGTDILYHAALDANNACQLWRLKAGQADNTYYLCSQGLQAGTIEVNGNVVVKMVESGEPYKLWSKDISGTTYYGFSRSSTTSDTEQYFLHAVAFGKSHSDTWYPASNKGDYVTRWDFGTSTTASQWTFEAVDEIDITIGTSGYASVNYDFPVKFPAGVKVYKKVQEAATYIKLEEIPAGSDGCVSLPTGNAAFVAGTEGASITLSILTDEPAAIDGGTGVSGTYLATTFDATSAANVYGIAKVDDVVAFYKMQGGTTIKQNKGYIQSATSSAPRMELTFSEGETTGIESVLEDNSRRESIDTSVLYDLNGRRVLYPSRGIYVTASGQRIFLK